MQFLSFNIQVAGKAINRKNKTGLIFIQLQIKNQSNRKGFILFLLLKFIMRIFVRFIDTTFYILYFKHKIQKNTH